MEVEATDFYNRTKQFNPTFWFLDVQEQSTKNMRSGVKAFAKKLRSLGAKKVGVYIAHHLYTKFNLDMRDFDAVCIPHYGSNNGKPTSKPKFNCDLHQYTDCGRLNGYSANLDLNQIINNKSLSYFTDGKQAPKKSSNKKKSTSKV
jgi:GH25 family lysozyme M1 (1,4-beta-N-acetylmuramidase)